MKNVIPEVDSKSMDIVADNISKLKELFPEAFTEGKVDFDALKEVLGGYIDGREERYSFTWNGKSKARMLAQTPSTGTLRPCKEESVDWDTTQNLFIEGDNLEVLKLLQKSYHKKVKIIYIDPPYNTGSDFVYKDNFKDNIKNYKEITGQVDSDGRTVSSNPETSGRYHTDWLNMIYPRLKLARNLLKDDGAIFISIDDNEAPNLRKVCDEIFGEENFVANIVWQKSKKGDSKLIAIVHEYILCYVKDKTKAIESGVWRTRKEGVDEVLEKYQLFCARHDHDHDRIREEMMAWYRGLKDSDPRKSHKHYNWSDDRGLYFPDNFAGPDDGRESRPRHDIIHPITGKPCKKPSTGWRWDEEKTKWAMMQQPPRIHFGEDENTIPTRKSYLKETALEPFGSHFYQDGRTATLQVEKLLSDGVFQFPKNTSVLAKLINLVTGPEDLILDFFAGSGSTAHACFELNNEENSSRKFILVQLPELLDANKKEQKSAYNYCIEQNIATNIAELSKARIRSTSEKITKENPEYRGDLGFKVFKLDSTNIKPWELDFDLMEQDLEDQISNIKQGRKEEDVLYEVLLKYGLDLTLPITEHTVSGYKIFDIGMGALMICLSDNITLEVIEGIAKLKDELNPEIMRVVFKDAGFADDVVKTNAVQILKQAGIEDVRSL